jgi:hypothetical protein
MGAPLTLTARRSVDDAASHATQARATCASCSQRAAEADKQRGAGANAAAIRRRRRSTRVALNVAWPVLAVAVVVAWHNVWTCRGSPGMQARAEDGL